MFKFGKLYAPFGHWRLFGPTISAELVRLQYCLADIPWIRDTSGGLDLICIKFTQKSYLRESLQKKNSPTWQLWKT